MRKLKTPVLLILMLGLSVAAFGKTASQPNIIYIMLDEWGYYESSGMGHPIFDTPNIDRFADEGMRFTQLMAGASVCAPTRGSLMTGQHTGHCSIRSNGGYILRPEDITIAKILQDAGYATGGFGKWGCGDVGTTGVPEKHGFDVFYGYYNQKHAHTFYPRYLIRNSEKIPLKGNTGDYHSGETFSHELIYQESLKFIRENKDRPFFAYLPFTPPHGHWMMPQDDPAWIKYKDKKWDAGMAKKDTDARMYAAMMEMIDREIGEILNLLRELEIDDNTIVFLCGDNGGAYYFPTEKYPHGFFAPNKDPRTGVEFRGNKGEFYEGGLRIPFLARWPGKIKAGSTSDHLGYFPDVMPTLADLVGIPTPERSDGISFLPTLLGKKGQQDHRYLYWEDPRKKMSAVRINEWKAVKPKGADQYELYNLNDDIQEHNNLSEKHPEIMEKVMRYAEEAHAPFLSGEVLDASLGFQGYEFD
ncbi:arylsulfatase [Pontiella sulfatireligans]|uniref:Arylsulfatase n=1 Tax=Pontiella sulfatireligans TaxID=2750658 RepID=A0A6C2UFJ4_9BACT|nr:arylsulfatase [Pontiella sulfatireligans]SPS74145.1 sulfatase S1_20 [Kiritimatiellales bacterium]VGO18297.1 Arylsulfatase [Pontiella sulfatireligans]